MNILKKILPLLFIGWYFGGWFVIYLRIRPYLSELPLILSVILTPLYFLVSFFAPPLMVFWYEEQALKNEIRSLVNNAPTQAHANQTHESDAYQAWLQTWKDIMTTLNKGHRYETMHQDVVPLIKNLKPDVAITLEEILAEAINYQQNYDDRWSGGWGFSSQYQEQISEVLDSALAHCV